VKRFILVLVVLAGGLAWACLAIPANAATISGQDLTSSVITQNDLNADIHAIASSPDYQCFLAAQEYAGSNGQETLPPIDGAGQTPGSSANPTATTAYVSQYLGTQIGHQLLINLATKQGVKPTTAQVNAARKSLVSQAQQTLTEVSQVESEITPCADAGAITGATVINSMPSWFNNQTAQFNATVLALESHLAPSTQADLMKYFNSNRHDFDNACVTVAAYSTESDAAAGLEKVNSGTPFAQVAAAATTGSGPQGCDILYGLAYEIDPSLLALKDNMVSTVLPYQSSYILLEITSRSPTTFAKAESAVRAAIGQAGNSELRQLLDATELSSHTHVTIDPRYGTWKATSAQVLVPTVPPVSDVLNAPANDPSAISTAASSTGGASTPATGSSG